MKLVGEEHLKPKYVEYVKSLEPGVSVTEVFLGLDLDLKEIGLGDVAEIFYCPTYDIEDLYKSVQTIAPLTGAPLSGGRLRVNRV